MGLLVSDVPTVLSPFPALTVLPAFRLSDLHLWNLAVILPMLLFSVWQPGLFRGEARAPKRSYVLLAVAAVLSVFYFIGSWKWGLEYQGPHHTRVVCAANIVWVAILGLAFARSWQGTTSYKFCLFLHWMLFAWLAWYAFPYLGDLA